MVALERLLGTPESLRRHDVALACENRLQLAKTEGPGCSGSYRERGAALVIALVTLLVVTMSILLAASFVQARVDAFRAEERRVMTNALADAAMAETLAHLDEDRSFSGFSDRAFDKGTISSTVTTKSPDIRGVTVTGRFASFQMVIDAEVDVRFSRARVVRWRHQHGPN